MTVLLLLALALAGLLAVKALVDHDGHLAGDLRSAAHTLRRYLTHGGTR
ncbi:hypothetical protein [Streptomyces chumphonensis]